MIQIAFIILPQTQILDLAGPLQAFYEAKNDYGQPFHISLNAMSHQVMAQQGLLLANVQHYSALELKAGDYIFIAGVGIQCFSDEEYLRESPQLFAWLNQMYAQDVHLCSVCSGAFVLAQAGLLDHRKCTTHWKSLQKLQKEFPKAKVQSDCLYIKDDNIYTSAGIASGIDLALSVIEEEQGALVASQVARELVIYMRRDGMENQTSVFLDYRTHLYEGIHKVQDWLIQHPQKKNTLEDLAEIAHMSSRNLSRLFRKATGITIKEFITKVRIELAKKLLQNPDLTIEAIAAQCGFQDARQLRRLWRQQFDSSPVQWRR